jgi:hypothetical protein
MLLQIHVKTISFMSPPSNNSVLCHVAGWKARGSNPYRSQRCFPSGKRPDRLCGPPSPLFVTYRGMKMTTHAYLVPKIIMSGAISLFRSHDFIPQTGTISTIYRVAKHFLITVTLSPPHVLVPIPGKLHIRLLGIADMAISQNCKRHQQ